MGAITLSESRVLGTITAFVGFSIGTFVAEELIDPLDGNRYNGGYEI